MGPFWKNTSTFFNVGVGVAFSSPSSLDSSRQLLPPNPGGCRQVHRWRVRQGGSCGQSEAWELLFRLVDDHTACTGCKLKGETLLQSSQVLKTIGAPSSCWPVTQPHTEAAHEGSATDRRILLRNWRPALKPCASVMPREPSTSCAF